MSKMKKVFSIILVLIMSVGLNNNVKPVKAATRITDNYTKETAYNFGSWSSFNSAGTTAIMAADEEESWFKFTAAPDEHIYIRVSSDRKYEGMNIQLKNSSGSNIGRSKNNPEDLIDLTGVTPSLYVDCDNLTSSSASYYLVVSRGNYDSSAPIYFGFSAANRIRTGQGTFSFSGSVSSAGRGADSPELKLDLSNNTLIPNQAIVTRVTTSGTQSPNQGSVHHKIQSAKSGVWYTSRVASATSGSYTISLTDNYDAAQIWKFKYNALAGAKSKMSSVKLTIRWQYDLKDTGYQIFIK